MKTSHRKEIRIGLLFIGTLALLYGGINFLKGKNLFSKTTLYYVQFENVRALTQSAPIYANGFRVGLVNDIRYDYAQPDKILVGIEVDRRLSIPKGSVAYLVTELLGTVHLDLALAAPQNSAYEPNDTLQGKIQMGLMDQISQQLLPQAMQMLPKLDSILCSLNQVLDNPAIQESLNNAEQLTGSLNRSSRVIERMVQSELPFLIDYYQKTGRNLEELSGNLAEQDYQATFAKVDSILTNLLAITQQLQQTNNSVGKFLNDTLLYQNLNDACRNASLLLEDVKKNPKQYVHFSVFGKRQNKDAKKN